jgi:hypothetical protein
MNNLTVHAPWQHSTSLATWSTTGLCTDMLVVLLMLALLLMLAHVKLWSTLPIAMARTSAHGSSCPARSRAHISKMWVHWSVRNRHTTTENCMHVDCTFCHVPPVARPG